MALGPTTSRIISNQRWSCDVLPKTVSLSPVSSTAPYL